MKREIYEHGTVAIIIVAENNANDNNTMITKLFGLPMTAYSGCEISTCPGPEAG